VRAVSVVPHNSSGNSGSLAAFDEPMLCPAWLDARSFVAQIGTDPVRHSYDPPAQTAEEPACRHKRTTAARA